MLCHCPDMVTNDFSGVYHGYAVEKRWLIVVTAICKKMKNLQLQRHNILISFGKHGELLQGTMFPTNLRVLNPNI
jgi:hypothetical protein